ncbi:MAG: pyridoxal phosphate-dependent class II aminotransferase [Deltaproteobacteria bacterium]|nr:pyridoxal phosphate-dependent class II aminotransferase [Deltaproteobacteria bacterium]MBW2099916.1 pyridoxal phosphate-dependent class II aminotransferase [Deltaproteobacteria bacterium]
MINGHGGNIYELAQRLGCPPSEILDMSSNVNPVGPLPGLISFLKENMNSITALPEVDAKKAVHAFAGRYGIHAQCVLAGNGTTQFIYSIPKALETKKALILGPAYADYADACIMHNVAYTCLTARESLSFKHDMNQIKEAVKGFDTVFICNPSNPTGALIPAAELELLCKSCPDTCFIIDESYLPFTGRGDRVSMINCGLSNVIILNSMSKIFRLPGLRIGFLISSEKIIEKFIRYSLPWSVNSLAQAAVIYLMEKTDEVDAFIGKTVRFLENEKKLLAERLENLRFIKLFPSTTSFVLARLFEDLTADAVCSHVAKDKILIRNCANFEGLSDKFIRISLKTSKTNRLLAQKLLELNNK